MYGTFICKGCHHKLDVKPEDAENIWKCPKCKCEYSNPHYISSFFDKFQSLEKSLHNLEFCGLTSGKPNIVYNSDLDNLNNLYVHSSSEIKRKLVRILDLNYMLAYQDAKDANIEVLEKVIKTLETALENK